MSKGVKEEYEVEKDIRVQETVILKSGIQSSKVDQIGEEKESFKSLGHEFSFFIHILGILFGILLVWFADVSKPNPKLCPNICQFWMCVQGLFFLVFNAIGFLAKLVSKEDNITALQEVVCSLFGLYMWIGFASYFCSWVVSFFSN